VAKTNVDGSGTGEANKALDRPATSQIEQAGKAGAKQRQKLEQK